MKIQNLKDNLANAKYYYFIKYKDKYVKDYYFTMKLNLTDDIKDAAWFTSKEEAQNFKESFINFGFRHLKICVKKIYMSEMNYNSKLLN